ncbi:MAG: SusD/RagB family nutrient-binding outer membrane lipoprotein [Bacteroidota bacterium]
MKSIYQIFMLSFLLLAGTACENNFEDINTDDTRPGSVDPVFQLNQGIIGTSPGGSVISYEFAILRQVHSPFRGVLEGANTNSTNPGSTGAVWNNFYPNVVKNLVDAVANTAQVPDRINASSALRIMRAYAFMTLTDTYGDVPYVEAGQGFLSQIEFPSYDTQESIYDDIISELQAATAAFNPGADDISQEILFGGDLDRWQRFGNSLLLRAGMRLSKVDPARAQTIVQSAIAGGLMQSNLDNAAIEHNPSFQYPVGNTLNGTESANYYLDRVFVDHLQANDDPRLEKIAVRYVGAVSGGEQSAGIATTDPALQFGLDQGFDQGGVDEVAAELGLVGLYDFSQADRNRIANQQAPSFLVTYAQTMLLLAEARVRGWDGGDPAEAYEAGIRGHMLQFASYPNSTAVEVAAIDDYIAAHPLTTGSELEQINTEYWIASFMAGYDGWANFRRSGFPDLEPNPLEGELTGSGERFIRRLVYPDGERTVNLENLNAAVSRQGNDELSTRIWWDQ